MLFCYLYDNFEIRNFKEGDNKMRVRRKPWAEEELLTNEQVIKEATEFKGRWNEEFGNDNIIYVEIGCGKGRFITETAKANPNINFVAIERQISVVATAARKLREENISNLRFVKGDVKFLQDYFEKNEIKRLYINFCDPWPKKRWAKRRLTYRDFLNIYKELIGIEGEIHFKTDNRDLFEFSLNEFADMDWRMSNITLDLHNSDFEGNIMTEYEEKFSSKGMPIYRLEAKVRN